MSNFSIGVNYGGRLWDTNDIGTGQTIAWGDFRIDVGHGNISLYTSFDLEVEQKIGLFNCLSVTPGQSPHWANLSPDLKPIVQEIGDKLRFGMQEADKQLREIVSATRLPVASFTHVELNSNQSRPVMHWSFNDQDLHDLEEALNLYNGDDGHRVRRGLQIPLPSPFEGRQVHVSNEHLLQLRERLLSHAEVLIPPTNSLMSVAWDSFTKYSFNSATIVLTTACETFLKWKLTQESEKVTQYLLDNMPSPMLSKLLSAARNYKGLIVPDKFNGWAGKLMQARNDCVHKPNQRNIYWHEFVRWYAMVESIIGASNGAEVDDFIGEYVRLTSQSHPEISGLEGVVLRWEVDYGDEGSFHVMLTDSTTIRVQENVLSKITSFSG